MPSVASRPFKLKSKAAVMMAGFALPLEFDMP